MSPLVRALRAVDPSTPDCVARFDDAVAEAGPDFYEWSVRVGAELSPHRLTYYFDVARRGSNVARDAGARFIALCHALDLPTTAALQTLVADAVPGRPEILQVVLGIDAAPSVRAKYYLVFQAEPGAVVRRVFDALDGIELPTVDPSKTYILGLDVGSAGVEDAKLYFRLDLALLPRVVKNIGDVADLVRGARSVVFQQCSTRPDRRQLYIHAKADTVIGPWLDAHAGFAELRRRERAVGEQLSAQRVAPWIISFPHHEGRLDLQESNVYFHLA